jgi:CRISPR-associated protein Csb2
MPLKYPDQGDRTKVFDTFVVPESRSPVEFLWTDATLEEEERRVTSLVLSRLGTLGRAESWCEARLIDPVPHGLRDRINCRPLESSIIPPGFEPVRVLAADPVTWSDWSYGKRAARPDPAWNLLAETADLHSERWSDPPGSRWIAYVLPSDALAVKPGSRQPRRATERPRFRVARYMIDAQVLPPVTETLPLAERARAYLMGIYNRVMQQSPRFEADPGEPSRFLSETFAGKDSGGRPLKDHGHAFYIPADEDGDGLIDHLTIFAERGFNSEEATAVDRFRHMKFGEGEPIRLVLIGLGSEGDLRAPHFEKAKTWVSATPFLASRYPKRRGQKRDDSDILRWDNEVGFVRHNLLEEFSRLRERRPDLTLPLTVEPLPDRKCGTRGLRPIQFKRYRRKRDDDGGRRLCGTFRVTFPEPIAGPLCVGHSSHFGMGLFIPER